MIANDQYIVDTHTSHLTLQVLHELLRSTETRNDMLRWLVNCIRDNMGRRQVELFIES